MPLQRRHNRLDSVPNRQPYDCLLNRLFRRWSKKTSKLASLAFVRGIHRGPVNSPHKWPVTRKMFLFDDVMWVIITFIVSWSWFLWLILVDQFWSINYIGQSWPCVRLSGKDSSFSASREVELGKSWFIIACWSARVNILPHFVAKLCPMIYFLYIFDSVFC